jgi:hypothetical protein
MYEAGPGLPEDLEPMGPGPEQLLRLARARDRLARARDRLVAHQHAQLLADLHAVAHTVPESAPESAPGSGPRSGQADPDRYAWAECEVGFALRWSYGWAARQLSFCEELIDRLPAVFAALEAGEIDVPKARVLVDSVACLDDQVARAIVSQVLATASRHTIGELRARLRRLVLAADPTLATRRARRDVADRRVQGFLNDNNLAALAGYELAPHRVAAVLERLDAIAKAAKSTGDPRRLDQLRADAFLDLLVGDGIAAGGPITDGGLGEGLGEASGQASGQA